jgi:hypothetical protein
MMSRDRWMGVILGAALAWALFPLVSRAADHGLVVGVNGCPNYRDQNNRAVRSLRGAEFGAMAFCDMLVNEYGFPTENVRLLTGGNADPKSRASYEAIRTWFGNQQRLSEGDQVVFYFGGHGTQRTDQQPDFDMEADGMDEALCPADARGDGNNLVVDDELASWLEEIPAKRITLIFDCCHAGTVDKGPGDSLQLVLPPVEAKGVQKNQFRGPIVAEQPWADLTKVAKGPSKTIIALYACDSSQRAHERLFDEVNVYPHRCQFTQYLLEGLTSRRALADSNRNGQVSVGEIADFATAEIDQWLSQKNRKLHLGSQEPSFNPKDVRDRVLFQ